MTRIKLAPVKPKVDEKSKVESLKVDEKSKVDEQKSKVESRKTSEAQLRAVKKYDEKNKRIRIPLEIKTQLDEHCNASGESLTGFIVRACLEQIKRDQMQN